MERESFTVYKSFYDLMALLKPNQKLKMYESIFEYGIYGKEPTFHDNVSKAVWNGILPLLKKNQKKYENGLKGKDGGSLGGRPKKETQASENYETIMEDMAVNKVVRPSLWEFIKHCQLNGHTVTNDKLEDVIYELDKQCGKDEFQKVKMLQDAVRGGWYDIRRKEYALG